MRSSRWLAFAFAVICALLALTPGSASADPSKKYMQRIADAFMADSSNHIYIDEHASPTISIGDENKLNQQILESGLPIYIVLADNVQVHEPGDESNLARTISKEMDAKSGHDIPAIIGVYTKDDFQAEAHHVAASLESNVDSFARHAYDAGAEAKASVMETLSHWIALVSTIEIRGPIRVPWKMIFAVVGAIVLIVGCGVLGWRISRRITRKREERIQEALASMPLYIAPRATCTFQLPSNRKRPRRTSRGHA